VTIPAKANGGLTIWCGKIEESDGDSKETDHTHRRNLSSRQRVSGIISTPYKNLSNRESLAGQNPTLFTTDAADAAPGFLVRKFIVGKLAMLRII